MNYSRDDLLYLARIASEADRLEEAIKFFKQAIQYDGELNRYDLTLLFDAYKYFINPKRRSLMSLYERKDMEEHRGGRFVSSIKELFNKIRAEMFDCCNDIVALIDNNLLKACKEDETRLTILTKKGDFLTYIARWESPVMKLEICQQAIKAYEEATVLATAKFRPNSYDRITLAQNFSSLYYYELEDQKFGFNLAKEALEKARIAEEEDNDERYLSHATPIDLLRDQVYLWMEELESTDNE